MSSSSEWSLIVSAERCLHPQARLQDWYKLFYQSWFGPGHLITDENAARDWLLYELAGELNFEEPLWQPIGLNFGRVHLGPWKARGLNVESLLSGFINSTSQPPALPLYAWKEQWMKVAVWLLREGLAAPDDSTQNNVSAALESGALMHHSEYYHQLYKPHYRVLCLDCWKQIKSQFNI